MPVRIDTVQIPIKVRKPKVHTAWVGWPILKISNWVQTLVQECPKVLLGGHRFEDDLGWKHIFSSFWAIYRTIDPDHPFFSSGISYTNAIPYYLHGDEGRGLRARPFLVESFQPVIAGQGLFETNEKGYLGYSWFRWSEFWGFTWWHF